ncbi:MAG TPA: hypothetical protein VMV46_08920 [Thermoanaerobaculia bacterium]|nr:hypothetical protein [Thermoanaerobaculia bacterium]
MLAAGLILALMLPGATGETAAAPCATLTALPPDLLERTAGDPLITMETQPGTALKVGTAVARIEAPLHLVAAIVDAHDEFARMFDTVKKSIILGAAENRKVVYMDVDLPFPIANRHYEIELEQHRWDGPGRTCWESHWKYLPGSGNIEDNHGRWELLGDGEVTWLAYIAFVDPGGKIPNWAVNWAARQALPQMIDSVRYEAQQRLRALSRVSR